MNNNETSTTNQAPAVPAFLESAALLFPMGPGMLMPFEYTGVKKEIDGYRKSAWIGTSLMISPIYDVVGPDAAKFLNSICTNDFSTLTMKGLRHAVICNEKGQILTDGVCIRIAEDRYRTYWLNPPIEFLLKKSGMNVTGEDMTGKEYFIQIDGEKSLEILEDAFESDLHDIKFATHRKAKMGDKDVEVVRLGMSGNLAYEIHGPINEFDEVYRKVWASGEKFGATKLGMLAYNLFNHTEAGFPNINVHYPLPWFESGEDMAAWMYANPAYSWYNINRKLQGSVGPDLESRFMTPYDVGWDFLVKYNHEFTGRKALEELSKKPHRTVVTLEWNGDDIGKVFATQFKPGEAACDSIAGESDSEYVTATAEQCFVYRADRVLCDGKDIGLSSGRIVSYHYNSMISLGFIDQAYAKEGTELTLIWGTPGTRQMEIRVKVSRYPYNSEFIRNENKDVEEIPHYSK